MKWGLNEEGTPLHVVGGASSVDSEEQKEHYGTAQELTLAQGYDLDMLVANQKMYQFYIEHGILPGVA